MSYTIKCTMYTVHCVNCTNSCYTMNEVNNTLYSVLYYTMFTILGNWNILHTDIRVYNPIFTVYSIKDFYIYILNSWEALIAYSVYWTLYSVYYTVSMSLYIEQCTIYTIHYTVYVHCTVYSVN